MAVMMIVAFLMGSIPSGVVFAKLFGLPDPRTIGSGNIGATNMLRTGNKKVALLTLLLDAAKGALPVLLCRHALGAGDGWVAATAAAAAMGHMYSPWLGFKGGKGVATLLGASIAFSFPIALMAMAIWLGLFLITHYVSLASIVAMTSIPLLTFLHVDAMASLWMACGCGVAIWRHRENIKRLRAGTESKTHLGKKGTA